ncbi:MAG: restriction endonuclease [Candidatus Hodarchaeales archaeon]
MTVWIIKLGQSNNFSGECLEAGIIGIGHDIDDASIKEIIEIDSEGDARAYLEEDFDSRGAGTALRFIWKAKKGDYVFCAPAWLSADPDDDSRGIILGEISSDPEKAKKNRQIGYLRTIRSVNWKVIDEDDLPAGVVDSIKRPRGTFTQSKRIKDIEAKEIYSSGILELADPVEKTYDNLIDSIISNFKNMNPAEFEYYVRDLLFMERWVDLEVTPQSRDDGIDITGYYPLVSAYYVPVIIQVKRYDKNVQAGEIEKFQAITVDNDYMLRFFVTSSDFSKRAYHKILDEPRVFTITGKELAEIALRHNLIPYTSWKLE